MTISISILLAGFLGGVVRGLVGFIKHQQSYKDVPFRPLYFTLMMLVSGGIGLLAAYVTADMGFTFLGLEMITPSVAVVLGYAGGDLLENIFKILIKEPTIWSVK
ncbi:MAG: hypothetical protein ACOCU8_03505 [Patescibacteria group bacterium]|jgi:hypothetical protein